MKVFKAAIYHFTSGKPDNAYFRRDNDLLRKFARTIGYVDIDTYCDYRTTRDEHDELDRLLSHIDDYDALFVMYYFHLNRYTLSALELIKSLNAKGIKVYSVQESKYIFEDMPNLMKPLNVATYYCHWGAKPDADIMQIKNETLKLFVDKRTSWNLIGQFSDELKKQHAGRQIELEHLMEFKERIDLILMPTFTSLNWQTNTFCRFKEQLQKDIYALEGGLLRKEHLL